MKFLLTRDERKQVDGLKVGRQACWLIKANSREEAEVIFEKRWAEHSPTVWRSKSNAKRTVEIKPTTKRFQWNSTAAALNDGETVRVIRLYLNNTEPKLPSTQ